MTIDPIPPYIWPEARVLQGLDEYSSPVAFESILKSGDCFFGILSGLDQSGMDWLESFCALEKAICCRLVVTVYPACPTSQIVLQSLFNLANSSSGRLEFRVLLAESWLDDLANAICIYKNDGSRAYFVIGSTPNLGLNRSSIGQANFVFQGEPILLEYWRKWFDHLWLSCCPLNDRTINIPPLLPGIGTEESGMLWQGYVGACTGACEKEEIEDSVTKNIDTGTGEADAAVPNSISLSLPSKILNIPEMDPLAEKITCLYGAGYQVTADDLTRIPTLDAPITAELFDIKKVRQEGAITRRLDYRISVINEKTLKSLNNKRNAGNLLLSKLSFVLGKGAHWMPDKAKPLFEQELDRINEAGKNQLTAALTGGVDCYVDSRKAQVIKDANLLYKEFHPNGAVPQSTIEKILDDMKERLRKASDGKFLPDYTFERLAFSIDHTPKWASHWGKFLLLLVSTAKLPRDCLYSNIFFMRGLSVTQDDILEAINVCNDDIIASRHDPGIRERARIELGILNHIKNLDAEQRMKCEAILGILNGTIWKFINGASINDIPEWIDTMKIQEFKLAD
jgi:hypothetical protein